MKNHPPVSPQSAPLALTALLSLFSLAGFAGTDFALKSADFEEVTVNLGLPRGSRSEYDRIRQMIAEAVAGHPQHPAARLYVEKTRWLAAEHYLPFIYGYSSLDQFDVREFKNRRWKPTESLVIISQAYYRATNPLWQPSPRQMHTIDFRSFDPYVRAYRGAMAVKVKWSSLRPNRTIEALSLEGYDFADCRLSEVSPRPAGDPGRPPSGHQLPVLIQDEFLASDATFDRLLVFLSAPEVIRYRKELRGWLARGNWVEYGSGSHVFFEYLGGPMAQAEEYRQSHSLQFTTELSLDRHDVASKTVRTDVIRGRFTLQWSEEKSKTEIVGGSFESLEIGKDREEPKPPGGGGAVTAD